MEHSAQRTDNGRSIHIVEKLNQIAIHKMGVLENDDNQRNLLK